MYARLTLGERLKDLRVEKHLTLEELSAETGFSSSALGKYEITPRNISHEVIMKLAEYYGVSCDYILGISENKKPLNVEVSELHLNDEMLTMLKEEKINNRLLCEIALHPDFLKKSGLKNKDLEIFWWEAFSIAESRTLDIQEIVISCAAKYFDDVVDKSNAYLFAVLIISSFISSSITCIPKSSTGALSSVII